MKILVKGGLSQSTRGISLPNMYNCLTDEQLDYINQNNQKVHFQKGETIRKQGTYMSHVIHMESGFAKLYLEENGYQNTITRILKAGSFVGGPGLYFDRLHHFSISALTDTKVVFIDGEIFKTLVDKNKQFAHEFIKDLSSMILSVNLRLIYLTHKHMMGRMADTLVYLCDEIFESLNLKNVLSRQDIADMSGMAKDSAVKTLRELQQANVIHIKDCEIEIINYDALVRISKTG